MLRRSSSWIIVLAILFSLFLPAQEIPEKAVCLVCVVHEGNENPQPEKVKAWSEHAGNRYYFCAKDCQEKFEEDPVAYIPPVFPYPAPAFAAASLSGEKKSLENYPGKAVLIDFWATWCAPCLKIMPELQKLHEKYADAGLVVLGISIDEEDAFKKLRKLIDKKSISYPVLLDTLETPAWAAFHVRAIPATFLLNQQGQVVARWLGRFDHRKAETEITRLLNDAPEKGL